MNNKMEKIDHYIMDNICHPISVDDLAELLYCSKFYFLREFKKLMDVTPYQYLMNKRLEQAKTKLSSTEANIAQISHQYGFNDQSHFTRAFKGHYGLTPGQYLKQIKNSVLNELYFMTREHIVLIKSTMCYSLIWQLVRFNINIIGLYIISKLHGFN